MSTSITLVESSQDVWQSPPSKPLDEAVWQAWVAKGRMRDARSSAARLTGVTWATIIGLFAVIGMWADPTPYDGVLRFIVCGGALIMMFHAIHARHYAVTAAFGAVALLYNPVAPMFGFSGGWQRAVVVASFTPFVVSLATPNVRREHNV